MKKLTTPTTAGRTPSPQARQMPPSPSPQAQEPGTPPKPTTISTRTKKAPVNLPEFRWYSLTKAAVRLPDNPRPELIESLLLQGERRCQALGLSIVHVYPSVPHDIPGQPDFATFYPDGVYRRPDQIPWTAVVGASVHKVLRAPNNPDIYEHPRRGLTVIDVLGTPAVSETYRMLYLVDSDGWPLFTARATRGTKIAGIKITPPPNADWGLGWHIDRAAVAA